ncbi:MAG: hypothetical protein DMF98_21910 [Acidobacteria bacterium]|nr:MAG: hypothetical protein DMF98_21910 [Acidobacteriota bacterium]
MYYATFRRRGDADTEFSQTDDVHYEILIRSARAQSLCDVTKLRLKPTSEKRCWTADLHY